MYLVFRVHGEIKSHREENMNAFSPIKNKGQRCTPASRGQNEYHNNNHLEK